MHLLQRLPGRHRCQQPVSHLRHQVQVEQVVDQPRAAVALGATLGQVLDQRRGIGETQLPAQQPLAEMLAAAGWSRIAWRNLSGGIVALHRAWAE